MDSETRIVRFLLTGDSRGALKAQDEAEKGFEKTGDAADDTDKHIGLLHKSFEGLKNVIGYGVGALGLGGVVFGLKDVVAGGKEWQEQQALLQNALKNTGEKGNAAVNAVNQAAERSATHGGFSSGEETHGIIQLINLTGKYTTAIKLNKSAVNLARGAHIEYSQALKLVSTAQAGTASRAQQYLGIIQPVKTYVDQLTEAQKRQNPELLRHAELLDKQATAMEINRVILEKYKNSTATYSKTASGAMSNFKNTLDLLETDLGRKLLPTITKVATALAGVAQKVINNWPKIQKSIEGVIKPIGDFFKAIIHSKTAVQALVAIMVPLSAIWAAHRVVSAYKDAVLGFKEVMVGLGFATQVTTGETLAWDTALDANPIGIAAAAILALVAAVVFAYMHFKTFREVVQAVFGAVKTVVLDAVNFIKRHWEALLAVFSLPLFSIVEIIKHFGQIKSVIESVFGSIGKFVEGVWNGIGKVIDGGINLIIKAINALISGYNKVQKALPFGLGAAQIKPLAEIGAGHKPAAPAGQADTGAGARRGKDLHVHLHIGSGGGREIAEAIIRDPWGARTLAEGTALYTKKLQARA